MKYPTKRPEPFAPMQRSRECEREQNRKFRRSATHMTGGQRRKEMRLMYVEIGNFALKARDPAVTRELLQEFEPYVRTVDPKTEGIKAKHAKMCQWYDAVRSDYLQAHQEDAMEAAQ